MLGPSQRRLPHNGTQGNPSLPSPGTGVLAPGGGHKTLQVTGAQMWVARECTKVAQPHKAASLWPGPCQGQLCHDKASTATTGLLSGANEGALMGVWIVYGTSTTCPCSARGEGPLALPGILMSVINTYPANSNTEKEHNSEELIQQ